MDIEPPRARSFSTESRPLQRRHGIGSQIDLQRLRTQHQLRPPLLARVCQHHHETSIGIAEARMRHRAARAVIANTIGREHARTPLDVLRIMRERPILPAARDLMRPILDCDDAAARKRPYIGLAFFIKREIP